MPASQQLRRALVLALAGGSLAIGVPVALAASGGDSAPATSSGGNTPSFIQDDQGGARPDRHDCPEHGGGGDGGSDQGGSAQDGSAGSGSGSATPTPAL